MIKRTLVALLVFSGVLLGACAQGAGPARALYVVKGNVFFWLVPYSWAWAPEDAKGLANKIVSRLP